MLESSEVHEVKRPSPYFRDEPWFSCINVKGYHYLYELPHFEEDLDLLMGKLLKKVEKEELL